MTSGLEGLESPSLNSAINSELLTISPSCLTIFVIVPLTGATTSKTTYLFQFQLLLHLVQQFRPLF